MTQPTLAVVFRNRGCTVGTMAEWSFLTNHARALLCIAHDPGVRLRDIAAALLVTERSAFGIVRDLVEAGYVVKERDGRRNRYQVQRHLPLPDPISHTRTVGEVLALLIGEEGAPHRGAGRPRTGRSAVRAEGSSRLRRRGGGS